jgi:hypothetical protein
VRSRALAHSSFHSAHVSDPRAWIWHVPKKDWGEHRRRTTTRRRRRGRRAERPGAFRREPVVRGSAAPDLSVGAGVSVAPRKDRRAQPAARRAAASFQRLFPEEGPAQSLSRGSQREVKAPELLYHNLLRTAQFRCKRATLGCRRARPVSRSPRARGSPPKRMCRNGAKDGCDGRFRPCRGAGTVN